MNLILFALLIFGCCYTTRSASTIDNGSPLMWLLVRQLERTNDDFKKLESQIEDMKTKVDSNGKHLEVLNGGVEIVKSQMDEKISRALQPINESLSRVKVQSGNNEIEIKAVKKIKGQFKDTISNVDSLGNHVKSLRVDIVKLQSGINSTLQYVKQSLKVQSEHNDQNLKTIDSKMKQLSSSVELLRNYHDCPNGWKKWNGHCYFFSRETLTWDQARLKCDGKESHLVKIENSFESNMLVAEVNKLGEKYYWIGANDISSEGTWEWVSDGTVMSYSNWGNGEPNNLGSDYVDCGHLHYLYGYQWDDHDCRNRQNYICEKVLFA